MICVPTLPHLFSDRVQHQVRSEAEFQELLGAMEEEVKKKSAVAVVPRMLVTEQVGV